MRVERRLVATRQDRRLTLAELAEFCRQAEGEGTDPGSWIKVQAGFRGFVRTVEIVPDPSRQGQDRPGGGLTDGR